MEQNPRPGRARARSLILCFDGTGNKFGGTPADSNILKIYSMLDHEDPNQYSYYQPGIGTYVESRSIRRAGSYYTRFMSWYAKQKDQMVGTSFAEHVVAGYKFLMRYYNDGDHIFFFGFSRGAYTARFLAEMIDYIGLLGSGNEEMVRFAWKTFARWQMRHTHGKEEKEKNEETFEFMKKFRETFSRPVSRIRFLGLFDTVNSVPLFEVAFMERSRFPYTARTSARVIRHAVSIDERRCKFRQDLISEHKNSSGPSELSEEVPKLAESHVDEKEQRSDLKKTNSKPKSRSAKTTNTAGGRFRPGRRQSAWQTASNHERKFFGHGDNGQEAKKDSHDEDETDENLEEDEDKQDIEEVWFPGVHADIGGGWPILPDEGQNPLSHVTLMWMIREAYKAGVPFDTDKLKEANYFPYEPLPLQLPTDATKAGGHSEHTAAARPDIGNYHKAVREAEASRSHDCLRYGRGLPRSAVATWQFMEYFPFRRMDLQDNNSWKPIRWPLPRGEGRDMPADAIIHGSALRRMQADPKYRPGNLVIGGGGRVPTTAPEKHGIGQWKVLRGEGDMLSECYVRQDVKHAVR